MMAPDAGRRQRGENGDGVHQALVQHAEHDIDGEQRGDDEQRLGGERLLKGLSGAGEGAAHRRRNTDPPFHLVDQPSVACPSETPGARLKETVTEGKNEE